MIKRLFTILACFSVTVCVAQTRLVRTVTAKEIKAIIDSSKTPLIVNFWASYCGPCISEIPYFERSVQQSPVPVKLILVSLDMPRLYPLKFKNFLQRSAYKSDLLLLKETDYDYPAIDKQWGGAIPASIFIDNSKHYYRLFNTQLTEPKLELELKNLLNYVALPLSSQ